MSVNPTPTQSASLSSGQKTAESQGGICNFFGKIREVFRQGGNSIGSCVRGIFRHKNNNKSLTNPSTKKREITAEENNNSPYTDTDSTFNKLIELFSQEKGTYSKIELLENFLQLAGFNTEEIKNNLKNGDGFCSELKALAKVADIDPEDENFAFVLQNILNDEKMDSDTKINFIRLLFGPNGRCPLEKMKPEKKENLKTGITTCIELFKENNPPLQSLKTYLENKQPVFQNLLGNLRNALQEKPAQESSPEGHGETPPPPPTVPTPVLPNTPEPPTSPTATTPSNGVTTPSQTPVTLKNLPPLPSYPAPTPPNVPPPPPTVPAPVLPNANPLPKAPTSPTATTPSNGVTTPSQTPVTLKNLPPLPSYPAPTPPNVPPPPPTVPAPVLPPDYIDTSIPPPYAAPVAPVDGTPPSANAVPTPTEQPEPTLQEYISTPSHYQTPPPRPPISLTVRVDRLIKKAEKEKVFSEEDKLVYDAILGSNTDKTTKDIDKAIEYIVKDFKDRKLDSASSFLAYLMQEGYKEEELKNMFIKEFISSSKMAIPVPETLQPQQIVQTPGIERPQHAITGKMAVVEEMPQKQYAVKEELIQPKQVSVSSVGLPQPQRATIVSGTQRPRSAVTETVKYPQQTVQIPRIEISPQPQQAVIEGVMPEQAVQKATYIQSAGEMPEQAIEEGIDIPPPSHQL